MAFCHTVRFWQCCFTVPILTPRTREPLSRVKKQSQRYFWRCYLPGIFVRVQPRRELDPPYLNTVCPQPLSIPLCRPIPGVVCIISQPHPAHVFQSLPQFLANTVRPTQAGHVAETVGPKRQRIESLFAHNDFFGIANAFRIQEAAMRSRGIKMLEHAVCHPATVEADHFVILTEEWHHNAAVEVFVATLAPQPEQPQPRAQRLALVAVLHR